MVWYFRQLLWPDDTSDHTVTWAEIAIDFQASTHCFVQRHHDQPLTLEQQACLFRAAAKKVSQICFAQVVPDLDSKVKVPAVSSEELLQTAQVHKILFAAALHPDANKPENKLI